jgi:hypothetical protein
VGREHDRAKVGPGRVNLTKHVQAVRLTGEWVELQSQKVRRSFLDHPKSLAARVGLSDNCYSNSVEDELDRIQPDRMGVKENRAQGRRRGSHSIAAARI